MKNLIFLCASTAIIIFTVIVLNNAPIINGLVGTDWYKESCQRYVDLHKYYKDKTPAQIGNTDYGVSDEDDKKEWLDLLIEGKNKCYRNKAMIGLEYSAFNFNIVFGFTCALLGLFNYLKIGNLGKIVGLIGLGSGIIGFVLTLVYIIYSGIIFTKDVAGKTFIDISAKYNSAERKKIRANGAFAEWDDSKKGYVCIFYEKDNENSLYLTYSDYGNIHLNYRSKDKYPEQEKNYEFIGCLSGSTYTYAQCKTKDETDNLAQTKNKYYENYVNQAANKNEKGECDYLYYFDNNANDYSKRNIYDRWTITIVLGCFIFVLDIGLAIFGFLIFKDGGSSGSPL
jgi:hypothetical protein